MTRVAVRIFHLDPSDGSGPLERTLGSARRALAERHMAAFRAAGADDVALVAGRPDDTPFGRRLRELVAAERPGGLVVVGSGGLPLATETDLRAFVAVARGPGRVALTNNRYSADSTAISCAESLLDLPDLPADNAIPRWLEEVAGYEVRDLGGRWRLAVDLDSPLDLLLTGLGAVPPGPASAQLAALKSAAGDRRAELVLAGRTSATTLRWLERHVPARVRALVEERGLRAASRLAMDEQRGAPLRAPRPPGSVLGLLLDRDGPAALGSILAQLGDAAIVDSRVLLAHRLGPDERSWPAAEDRFSSDLLLPDRIHDPWLRSLTEAAASAPIPVLLGGHSLVGPGIRLVFREARPGARAGR
jgi:hypothetical protein